MAYQKWFPLLQIAFWTSAAVSLIIALLWLVVVREKHFSSEHTPAMENVPVKEALSSCFKSRNIWLMGISLMFLLGGATVISNFQVAALTSVKGYSEAFAGTFGTVLMIGAIIGSIFIPVLVSRSPGKTPVYLLVCGLVSAVCIIVPLGHGNISAYFYLGALCIAISSFICFFMAKTCGVYGPKKDSNFAGESKKITA